MGFSGAAADFIHQMLGSPGSVPRLTVPEADEFDPLRTEA